MKIPAMTPCEMAGDSGDEWESAGEAGLAGEAGMVANGEVFIYMLTR
jgi:hypothetical protein